MTTLLLEALGLALAAPLLLSRLKNMRIAIPGMVLLAGILGFYALSHLSNARRIERDLSQRVWYRLTRDNTGALSATIHPLSGTEGIFVSVVDLPSGTTVSGSFLQKVPWKLNDPGDTPFCGATWHEHATSKCEDDGIPLFEIGGRYLTNSVSLRVDAPQDFPWLEQVRLQVRPCWFTLKMYPIIATAYWVRTAACSFGFALCLLFMALKLKGKRQEPAMSSSAAP